MVHFYATEGDRALLYYPATGDFSVREQRPRVTGKLPNALSRVASLDGLGKSPVLGLGAAWDVVNASKRLRLQAHKLRYRRFICAD